MPKPLKKAPKPPLKAQKLLPKVLKLLPKALKKLPQKLLNKQLIRVCGMPGHAAWHPRRSGLYEKACKPSPHGRVFVCMTPRQWARPRHA
ncbi:MAG: hypothetical protein R3D89_08570 [Sphingomonadaceae bacterium]